MRITTLVVSIALTTLTGCASIVNGQNQSVSVETRAGGNSVSGANCTLSNNKGTWYVTTPGSTTVNRSYEDLAVRCDKTSMEPGLASVKSATKAMAFGNIIFGGVIGAGIDIGTGAAYDYPTLITVAMGSSSVVGAPQVNPSDSAVPPGPGGPPIPNQGTSAAIAQPVSTTATAPQNVGSAQPGAALAPAPLPAGIVQLPRQPAPPPPPKPIGVDSYSAERLARQAGCNIDPAATLIAKGPGYESFSVQCTNSDVLMIRCESGNCRELK